MNKKKVIIFDFDGVIVDALDVVFFLLNKLAKKYNLPEFTTKAQVRQLYQTNFYQSLAKLGLPREEGRKLKAEIKDGLLKHKNKVVLFEGMSDLIKILAKEYPIYIVSSNLNEVIKSFLKEFGLEKSVKEILGADEETDKVVKIKDVLQKEQVDGKEVVFIGDTVGDIKEGKKAGVVTIGVSWGYHDEKLLQTAKPDYLCDSVASLRKFLLNC